MSQQRRWTAGQPVSVGFGGAVAGDRIVALANPKSAPIQRTVRQAREEGRLIDLTFGRRIRAVLFMDSGHVIRVAVSPDTLFVRWSEGPHPPAPSPDPGGGRARDGAEDEGEDCMEGPHPSTPSPNPGGRREAKRRVGVRTVGGDRGTKCCGRGSGAG